MSDKTTAKRKLNKLCEKARELALNSPIADSSEALWLGPDGVWRFKEPHVSKAISEEAYQLLSRSRERHLKKIYYDTFLKDEETKR